MKYFIASLLLFSTLISCKREYTCNCLVATAAGANPHDISVKSKSDISSRQKACEYEQVKRSTQTETWECYTK